MTVCMAAFACRRTGASTEFTAAHTHASAQNPSHEREYAYFDEHDGSGK